MLQPTASQSEAMGQGQSQYNRKSTAYDIADDHFGDLDDMVVIVTGSNSGIGREVAKVLAFKRCHVFLGCRDLSNGEKAATDIRNSSANPSMINIEVLHLDLASFSSIRDFAQMFLRKEVPLHVLINNAGIMAVPDYQETENGFELQWGVNYLGHFYLTNLLMDRLIESSPSRVVNVSSSQHANSAPIDKLWLPPSPEQYGAWDNYALSKLCLILFANECHRRFKDEGVSCVSLNPGNVATDLDRNNLTAKVLFTISYFFSKSVSQGAATPMYCAIGRHLEGGCYYENCAKSQASPQAYDELQSRRLWDLSMRLTGLERTVVDKFSPSNAGTVDEIKSEDCDMSDRVFGSAPVASRSYLPPHAPPTAFEPSDMSDNASDVSSFQKARLRGLSAPNWVPDKKSKTCQRCMKNFNFFNRRHHCRYCGRLVCSSCSRRHIRSIFYHGKTQRTCEDCVNDAESDVERFRGSIYMPI